MNRGSRGDQLAKPILIALLVLLSMAVVPHVGHLSPWVSGLFAALVGLRLAGLSQPRALPGRLLLLLLTMGATANVLIHTPSLLSRDAGVALMTSMLGLKLMELKTPRDVYVTVFLGYFLVITNVLYDQNLLLVAYLFLVIGGFTAVLVEINRSEAGAQPWQSLKQALVLLLQAAPIMLFLFLLFPRLPGPLWGIGTQASTAITGLSDQLDPGGITRLIQSDETAFRVEFEAQAQAPPPDQRYWRGPVLWDTDGRRWSAGEPRWVEHAPARFKALGPPVRYTIMLEPSDRRWLFALDLPGELPDRSRVSADYQLVAHDEISTRRRYPMSSYPAYATLGLEPEARARGLALPDNVSDRILSLAATWRTDATNDAEVVQHGLRFFHDSPFVYTLSPPALGDNPADEFLFETRRGFCEHYATSFTLLMRAADIPARIVTGYQGGEFNPVGGYYRIRQSDAHAWVEVWLAEVGWLRVDPTAAVAPERVERSIDTRVTDSGAAVRFYIEAPGYLAATLRRIGFAWDSLNNGWHHWVLGYTDKRQRGFLDRLGLEFLHGGRALGIAMVVVTGMIMIIVAVATGLKTRPRSDAVQAIYLRYCRRLARLGLVRQSGEGPRAFAGRVGTNRPDLRAPVEHITELYIRLRYGRGGGASDLGELKRLVRRLGAETRLLRLLRLLRTGPSRLKGT